MSQTNTSHLLLLYSPSSLVYGVFTLVVTDTGTETDTDKMSLSVWKPPHNCLLVFISVSVSGSVNTPLLMVGLLLFRMLELLVFDEALFLHWRLINIPLLSLSFFKSILSGQETEFEMSFPDSSDAHCFRDNRVSVHSCWHLLASGKTHFIFNRASFKID